MFNNNDCSLFQFINCIKNKSKDNKDSFLAINIGFLSAKTKFFYSDNSYIGIDDYGVYLPAGYSYRLRTRYSPLSDAYTLESNHVFAAVFSIGLGMGYHGSFDQSITSFAFRPQVGFTMFELFYVRYGYNLYSNNTSKLNEHNVSITIPFGFFKDIHRDKYKIFSWWGYIPHILEENRELKDYK